MSFSPFTTPLPGSPSPIPSMPGLPMGSPSGGFDSAHQMAFEQAIHNSPDLAGIWDTIKNSGGDVWGVIAKLLPKDGNGNIDWGKIGSNVFGFIQDHGKDILAGLSAINQYQRQGQADTYAKQALDLAKQSYAERQPLRDAGMQGMLHPEQNTPDLSGLRAQGQSAASSRVALPMAQDRSFLNNAAQVAGPQSGNPFAKALPLAPQALAPTPAPASRPVPPSRPGFTPQTPTPTPMGGQPGGFGPMPPVPQALQFASQSGAIKNGPQDRKLPTFPSGLPQYGLSPLPLAG